MSNNTITLTGVVATEPRLIVTSAGLSICSFRLASTNRRYDTEQEKWVDGETNWFTVTCFRNLASNVAGSLSKGDRVLVSGWLRVREWETGESKGTNVEVEADSVGHDLSWGTTVLTRTTSTPADDSSTPI